MDFGFRKTAEKRKLFMQCPIFTKVQSLTYRIKLGHMKSLDGVGGHVQNTMLALNRKCHIYVSTFREGIINNNYNNYENFAV